jgi:hypothetical protein
MISELGLVYFLGRTEDRKAVAVYIVSLAANAGMDRFSHRERAHLLEHFLL